jgi:hypothetical protein
VNDAFSIPVPPAQSIHAGIRKTHDDPFKKLNLNPAVDRSFGKIVRIVGSHVAQCAALIAPYFSTFPPYFSFPA